jgi:hypothetical protein
MLRSLIADVVRAQDNICTPALNGFECVDCHTLSQYDRLFRLLWLKLWDRYRPKFDVGEQNDNL